MKKLFERHRASMTAAEERRVWDAIARAAEKRRRGFRFFALPAAAVATAATAVLVLVLVRETGGPDAMRPPVPEARETMSQGASPQDEGRAQESREPAARGAETRAMPPGADALSRAAAPAPEKSGEVSGTETEAPIAGADVPRGRAIDSGMEPPALKTVPQEPTETADERFAEARRSEAYREGAASPAREEAPATSRNEPEADDRTRMDVGSERVRTETRALELKSTAAPTREPDRGRSAAHDLGDVVLGEGAGSQELVPTDTDAHLMRMPTTGPEGQTALERTREKKIGGPIAVGGQAPVNAKAFDAMFFEHYGVNPSIDTDDDRFATFAMDVDDASYAIAREYLSRGALPPKEAVRVEEFVNAFDHGYSPPRKELFASREPRLVHERTFAIHLDAAPSPFGADRTLLRVGLKGREVHASARKAANLTFVVDVSGSMSREGRLELVKDALFDLLDQLDRFDRVAIVTYNQRADVRILHTSVAKRREIESVIASLEPDGSTNAEAGLRLGYDLADRAFDRDKINRVILLSDGVANVGLTGADDILERIKSSTGRGIYLTAIGVGMGNYNDVLLEKLADQGDGHYHYVNTREEAHRVFVENLTGTLQAIARDAKIQVEFDPEAVQSYRLLGYENRDVADRDFRNDAVDAGEVGAGHEVTALFELKLQDEGEIGRGSRGGHEGEVWEKPLLKRRFESRGEPDGDVLATVRIRYEDPETGNVDEDYDTILVSDVVSRFERTTPSFQLDAAVAEFAEILRHSYWAKDGSLTGVRELALSVEPDLEGREDVREFVDLVDRAIDLWPEAEPTPWRERD
jgi:Ca-activated chloride channel family protein